MNDLPANLDIFLKKQGSLVASVALEASADRRRFEPGDAQVQTIPVFSLTTSAGG
jgi:hypothetical protein